MFVEMFRASVDMMTSDIGEQYAPPARPPTGNRMLLLQNHKFVGRKYFLGNIFCIVEIFFSGVFLD